MKYLYYVSFGLSMVHPLQKYIEVSPVSITDEQSREEKIGWATDMWKIYIYIYIYILHTHTYIYIYISLLSWSVFHGFPDVAFPCSLHDLLFLLLSPGPLCVYILFAIHFNCACDINLLRSTVLTSYLYTSVPFLFQLIWLFQPHFNRHNNSPNYYWMQFEISKCACSFS